MTRGRIAGWAFAAVLVVVVILVAEYRTLDRDVAPAAASSVAEPSTASAPAQANQEPLAEGPATERDRGFLYGRITTVEGATYEGRLRWGGGREEAFWTDTFNGAKHENAWLAHVPPGRLPTRTRPLEIFGIKVADRELELDFGRLFLARFGELARLDAHGKLVRVTLKNGTVYDLDRFEASDFDDDLRVWAGGREVDLPSVRIRTVELLPTPALADVPARLHGTVRTRQGTFTGFVAWDREESVGTDELDGRSAEGELGLRYDTIRSLVRRPRGSVVTLLDGREIALSEAGEAGPDNRGINVDDPRYGRVQVSWDAFERVDFGPADGLGASGPAYDDFPPGSPLTGSVTTRDGRRLAGRLVYDLDESESTETLDAPSQGVNYTIPLGLLASIVLSGGDQPSPELAQVIRHGGEELRLEREGDLGPRNAGVLVFVDPQERPEYVPWTDVRRVDLDRPPAMYPPLGGP